MSADHERLTEKHYITLLVRLVVDPHSQRVQGEIVDLEAHNLGQFQGWGGLVHTLRAALSHLVPGDRDTEQ